MAVVGLGIEPVFRCIFPLCQTKPLFQQPDFRLENKLFDFSRSAYALLPFNEQEADQLLGAQP